MEHTELTHLLDKYGSENSQSHVYEVFDQIPLPFPPAVSLSLDLQDLPLNKLNEG